MVAFLMFSIFGLFGLVVLLAIVFNGLLLKKFIKHYPDIAAQNIPFYDSYTAHPKKIYFFFSKKFEVVASKDKELMKLKVIMLTNIVFALLIPLIGFLIFITMYYLEVN